MNEWLRTLRSIPFRFIHLEGDDAIHHHALQSRERARALADALQLNVVQVCLEIWSFKRKKEAALNTTLSADAVSKFYNIVDWAPSSEERSAKMIDNALTICRRLLTVPSIKNLLMAIEERYPCGSPLNSVFKLQEIIDRGGGNKDVIFWILSKIDDELRTGVLSASDVTCRNLKRNTAKSITDIICAKQAMKNYLLTTVLDSKNIRQDCKANIRELLQSVETYRSH